MSKRTRRLVGLAALVSLGMLGLAVWLVWPRTDINQANFERIQVGMTLAEVEGILGGPARDESTGSLLPDLGEDTPADGEKQMVAELEAWAVFWDCSWMDGATHHWKSDRFAIYVALSADGKVRRFSAMPVYVIRARPLQRLWRWLASDPLAPCQRDILEILASVDPRMTTEEILRALARANRIHSNSTVFRVLAALTKGGTLINGKGTGEKGYAIADEQNGMLTAAG